MSRRLKQRKIDGECGSALSEFVILMPLCAILVLLPLYLNDFLQESIFLVLGTRNLSETDFTEKESINNDSEKVRRLTSFPWLSSEKAKGLPVPPSDAVNIGDAQRLVGRRLELDRSREPWKEQRLNLLLPVEAKAQVYLDLSKLESHLSSWSNVILDPMSLLMIDDKRSAISYQVDTRLPLKEPLFALELDRLFGLAASVAPQSLEVNSDLLHKSAHFANLRLLAVEAGYHPTSYRLGALSGFALHAIKPGPFQWLMKSKDFRSSKPRLKQGFSRACLYEFRASSECVYHNIFSANLYSQILVYTAESAGAFDVIAALFSDDASTAAKRSAWEFLKRSFEDVGDRMMNDVEQMVKEKVEKEAKALSQALEERVKNELHTQLKKLNEQVGGESLKERLLSWLGIRAGEPS